MTSKLKILAVDDEPFNLDIMTDYLQEAGYDIVQANDGDVALRQLEQHSDVAAVVLDRMMPNLNGIEVMRTMKQHANWKDIPVVMQTAAAATMQILEGIQAGVYYYLTKPYEEAMLISIVKAAIQDRLSKLEMREEVSRHKRTLGLLEEGRFRFRTLDEAKNLSYFVANCFPEPEAVIYGLSELMINSIEHGNLGITYPEKTHLVRAGAWQKEIERRLGMPQNETKFAYLTLVAEPTRISIRIRDQGEGFDWKKYLDISPDRATDPHGRGIAVTRMMSFPEIEYLGKGNEVKCVLDFAKGAELISKASAA